MKLPRFLLNAVKKTYEVFGGTWTTLSGKSDDDIGENVNPRDVYKDFVAAAIIVRANAVASSKFELVEIKKGGDEVIVNEHPMLTLLNDVNPYFTKYWLFQRLSAHLDLYGNEYWWIVRGADKRTPYEIFPLNPELVTPVNDSKTYVSGYSYRQQDGKTIVFPAKDIIHFKEFNPFEDTLGMSLIDTASGIILTDKYLTAYNKNYFKNSAMPDVAIEVPAELGDDQVAQIRQDWIREFSGPRKRGVPAVMHSGSKVIKFQGSIADMQVVAQSNNNRDNILAMFGTSKTMLGLVENVNLANVRAQESIFDRRTIYPRNTNIAITISEFLVYQFDSNADSLTKTSQRYVLRAKIEPVSDQETTTRCQMQYNAGIITKNEWRAAEGIPAIDGGDVFINDERMAPETEIPVEDTELDGTKGTRSLLESVMRVNGYGKSLVTFDTATGEITEEQPAPVINPPAPELTKRQQLHARLPRQKRKTYEEFNAIGAALKAKQDASENANMGKVKDAVMGLIEDQIDRAMKNVEAPTKALGPLLDRKKEIKTTIDLLTPILAKIIKQEGDLALAEVGASKEDWTANRPSVRKYLKESTKKLAGSMTDTTIEAIRSAVADGLDAEEGIAEIKERVMNASNLGEDRAEMIALTETHRASAFAELDAWKESGVVSHKEWRTADDERTCEDCAMMDGVEVGIDDPFLTVADLADIDINNYDGAVETALMHPRCRCTVIPVIN